MVADTAMIENGYLIRDLYGRYALAATRQDGPAWMACWARQGCWKTPHFEVTGHAALQQTWNATWTNFKSVAAFNELGAIELAGDRARSSSAVLEHITVRTGGRMTMCGLYDDELIFEEGRWRFLRREYSLVSQEIGG